MVTWRGSVKLFLRPAVVGFRSARACWTGQWPQPLSHGMEYALQTVVRVPLFAIFSQPTLPRFLQFPHSSQCRLLLPFGTRRGKVRSFGPLSALSAPLNRTFTTPLLPPPSVNFNFSNGSTTTSSSPHTARRQGPASPHSLRRSTPPATSEAEARGASTFQGPPSAPPSAPMNNISLHHSQGQSKAGTCNISLFRNLQDCVTLQF